jgi:microcompartment protein CcmK/EutM
MQFAKVIGNIVASCKTGNTNGKRLLVAKYLDENLQPRTRTVACIDTVEANIGDIVLLCGSSSARMAKYMSDVCTDVTVVAIVDTVSKEKKDLFSK